MPDGHPHIAVFSYREDGPFFLNFLPVEEPVGLYGPEGGCDYRVGNHIVQTEWRRLPSLDEVIAEVDKWADGYIRSPAPPPSPPSIIP